MIDIADIVKNSIESLATDIVTKAKLEPVSVKIAKTYKFYCVCKTTIKGVSHLSYGNYFSAAGEIVRFLAIDQMSDAASDWIIEKGGFVSTVTVADSGLIISADIIECVEGPLSSDYNNMLLGVYNKLEDYDAHRLLISDRSFKAEIQANYSKDQAIRASVFAEKQRPSELMRNLINTFPSIKRFMYGEELMFGVRRYPGSTIYQGTLFGEMREGYGVLQNESSGLYAGTWRNNEAFGYGVRMYPNGVEYHGEYANVILPNGKHSGVSIHRKSGARYVGEHKLDRTHGFNMIPDGYGVGYVNNRKLKGFWERGVFVQHFESKEDIDRMGRKMILDAEAGRPLQKIEVGVRERIETPFMEVKKYFKTGSLILLDGSFF